MIVSDGKFEYLTEGSGTPMIFLHGLMGNLSNFRHQVDYFSSRGYEVVVPLLPLYSMPLATTSVSSLTKFVKKFIDHRGYTKVILVGNSLGGHIALLFQKLYPSYLKSIVLSGSSGLYEAAMGNSYPRRGDRDYIAERVRDVFHIKEVATEELIDQVFSTVNDRMKAIKTLAISKSAIRHNMAEDITSFHLPVCLIWGRQDAVTPPEVADKFHELLPNSDLFWIDHCGHAAMMEHPQEFNTIVDEWLKKNEVA
ncbi:MAG: alpha/beta hydrolase [Schleiferiaceae bacterium]|jgi:2-hydroxy-6-oxonona-2,4-dienedioate hydrolase|nr:alpha/beta hydrolase [Schleiferiaceae bacterium]MDP4628413.1 alpha/beta hydrolase [Schleiferiaceae bacterium]MDP4742858.1 alpha/beta hydrolase [Schleiferiaceae bacterium]MDP4773286.1 alpha/beta hydrolase [Schleiferiaceae bacterium]MDP4931907.1 alpha/beta hydrolase [Schleiferiaceae bacterium]